MFFCFQSTYMKLPISYPSFSCKFTSIITKEAEHTKKVTCPFSYWYVCVFIYKIFLNTYIYIWVTWTFLLLLFLLMLIAYWFGNWGRTNPRVIESWNGLGWKGPYRSSRSNPPAMGRDTFHQSRVLKCSHGISDHQKLCWTMNTVLKLQTRMLKNLSRLIFRSCLLFFQVPILVDKQMSCVQLNLGSHPQHRQLKL